MAQSGYTPISIYYSTTASAVPLAANLANGELALNTADMKLYSKNSSGVVTLLASNAGASGSVTSVAVSGGTTGLTTSGGPITTSGTITLAGTLATANGGTNLTSFTSGGAVYATSTSALTTGTLPIASGGTGQTTASAAFNALSPITSTGDLILGNGVNSATRLAIGANGYVLTSNGTTASWSALAAGVSSFSAGTTGFTPSTGTTGAVTLAGTLATTNGGTGLTSFTSGGVVYASSTSALATGTSLYFNGTNLGVGTNSLAATNKLTVQQSSTTDGATAIVASATGVTTGTNYGLYSSVSGATVRNWGLYVQAGDAYVAGNVGIGTSSPNAKLEISATTEQLRLTNSSNRVRFTTETDGTLTIGNTSFSLITLKQNIGGAVVYGGFQYVDTNRDFALGAASGKGVAILVNGASTASAYFDSSGNLGLGVTPSASTLPTIQSTYGVLSGNTNINIMNNAYYNSGWKYVGTGLAAQYQQDTGKHIWYTAASGTAGNAITFTQAMTLSAAGGLSVGTTADPGAGAIYATGAITAFYSDKRLKTVSGKIENALDKVGQLSGVYYTNNDTAKSFGYDSDEVQVGVLAQEVEAVLPQVVKAAPFDLDEYGNSKSGENYKTVQYEKLVPLLIEAINELRAEVKALKGTI